MKKAFQTHIIMRFMGSDKLDELLETYNAARIKSGREKRVVCLQDVQIYEAYRAGALIQDLAAQYGRSYWWVWKSIRLAAEDANK